MIRRIVLSVLGAAALLLPATLRAEDAMDLRWFPLNGDGESFFRKKPTPESTKAGPASDYEGYPMDEE